MGCASVTVFNARNLSRGARSVSISSVLRLGFSHPAGCEMRGLTQFGLERCFEFLETDGHWQKPLLSAGLKRTIA
jgi:hypothetical protein